MHRLMAIGLALAVPAVATGHDFWVERTPQGFSARLGHRGEAALAIDPAEVKGIRCVLAVGAQKGVLRSARFALENIRPEDCAAVSVFRDGGYWSLTPDGEVNLPKSRAASAVKSWASRQYAKWVDAKSPRAGEALSEELELVPGADLARARAGDKITLRVLSHGQPVPNAVVAIDHRPIGETDSKGETRLRVRTAGVACISTSLRRARATPEADAEVLEATLTFEVPR